MQHMEHIEQAARRLYRIKASLELVAKAGPEAGFANVMEVNDLMREEVARVLILLDQAGQIQEVPVASGTGIESLLADDLAKALNSSGPPSASAAIAPAPKEKGEVLAFRPSPTA